MAAGPGLPAGPIPEGGTVRPLADPRFPDVATDRGHYESWYLKAGDRDRGLAIWIRYTVHKRPGRLPEGSLWFTLFDVEAERPFAVKQTAGPGSAIPGSGCFLEVEGLGSFGPDRAAGTISGMDREASWQLEITGTEAPLEHLPSRLYETGFPRTKLLTVQPAGRFSGTVEAGGRKVELDGWPGMIGHNWGVRHAERWIWLHGTDFEGRGPDTWIDLACGQLRIGRWTTPWVTNGAVSIDGDRFRLGGILKSLRGSRIRPESGGGRITVGSDGLDLSARISAPAGNTVAWVYADPDGSEHHTLNCSISGLEVTASGTGREPVELRTATGAAYEYGSRDFTHGIPVEPFTDG
ncbi:MAG: hypothetical protein M9938_03695 [Solirubrobacterales bacterium]|nr:hypothetical protein [Solirubrobacterales bacterium]